MKKILITGGTGFIGKNLIKYIDENHHDYICCHIDSSVDITDRFEVKDMLEDYQPDVIIHLAAISNPSHPDKEEMWRINVDGTRHLLNNTPPDTRFIFASSINVYGDGSHGIYTTVNPSDFYGASKATGEILVSTANNRGIRASSLRLCGVVGPDLTHGAIKSMIQEIQISGTATIFGRGEGAKKPFLHIDDVCKAICLAIKKDKFDVLNINNQDVISTNDIADMILAQYYRDMSDEDRRQKKKFVDMLVKNQYRNDGKLAELMLDWKPSMSSRQAVEKAIGENL